ncbi:MAG: hypothetical protein ACYS99_12265, partial [Planctomycetota bacterium]
IIREYLRHTGRNTWVKVRPFIDAAFMQGARSQVTAAETLGRLRSNQRPDKAYVEDVLQRYELSDDLKRQLRSWFGIE